MKDIKCFDTFVKIEPINKGKSGDKKYRIETAAGEKLLLRVSDAGKLERKKIEYGMLKRASALDINLSVPVDFGIFNDGKSVYQLIKWVEGDDLESVFPDLSDAERYAFGLKAGGLLKKIHTLQAPKGAEPWDTWFYRKVQENIGYYATSPIKSEGGDLVIRYLREKKFLLAGRSQTFNHGDCNRTNLIVMPNGEIGVIDFDCYNKDKDHGDPWYEFIPMNWVGAADPYFCTGMLNGYFGGGPPRIFFEVFAYYLTYDALAVLCESFMNGEPENGAGHLADILSWTNNLENIVPTWYLQAFAGRSVRNQQETQ